jgi:hypothetical protein
MRFATAWQRPRPAEEFRAVESNLRESFRVLAPGRPRGEIAELPGVSIASLGVAFQMFNAAFISEPVFGIDQFAERVRMAKRHFMMSGQHWSLWVCEDWLDRPTRRQAGKLCHSYGLRMASEVPGMIAAGIDEPRRPLPALEYKRVADGRVLNDFAGIGTVCFNVPPPWYREVFDASLVEREFVAWVGYLDGSPVATAATVTADGVIGLYNVATSPMFRGKGFGEAITRYAIGEAWREAPDAPVVLQASSMGVNIYGAMGFRAVTRFAVYNS